MRDLKTNLNDRTLRYDGVNIVTPEQVPSLLMYGILPAQIKVTSIDDDVRMFNANVAAADQILLAIDEPISIPLRWTIPTKYLDLDLTEYVISIYESRLQKLNFSAHELELAENRIAAELVEIERRGMVEFVKTVIFIIDEFRKANVVWGVGRGSSCASYILFLLGLHLVDPIKFDIPMDEFFHD